MNGYTISQFARAADVAVSTVRYYERLGLLKTSSRSSANYRLYGGGELARLRFILSAKAMGFSLEDVALLLSMLDETPSCGSVQDLIRKRLEVLRARIAELRHAERLLRSAIARCADGDAEDDHCSVLEGLRLAADPALAGRPPRGHRT
jgi:MerR family Zn(II)-responsive transcriptional regulator of zntA